MLEVKAPDPIPQTPFFRIFLAGSIEMGSAAQWQQTIVDALADKDVTIINPRRDDWDSSWEQSITNTEFCRQVNWELDGIEWSDIVVFYFDPNTKSPITLMELGYMAGWIPSRCIVCCPEGFWRKGNVDIMCMREKIPQVATLVELITKVRETIDIIRPKLLAI